jgi:hypothetical protein
MKLTADQMNTLNYFILALGAFVLGCAAALVPQLMDPSMPDLNFRVVIGTGLTAVLTAYGGSRLPRTGSARLAADVKALQQDGVHRSEMSVIRTEDLALLQSEAARIRRIKPLREAAAADEALERQGQRG